MEGDVIMPDGTAGRDPVLAKALTMAGYPTDAALAGTILP
jgi:hypothetical protein